MSASTFEEAVALVNNLNSKPSNDELLAIYGLYKQATVGDVNISQPWAVQIEARSKYDAWEANKGKSQDEAKAQYINLANEAAKTYGVKA